MTPSNFSLALDPQMIENQIRFLLTSHVLPETGDIPFRAECVPRCPELHGAEGGEWEKNNVVANALIRIDIARRAGTSADVGRKRKYLRFLYNGTTYVPGWQFARNKKLLPFVVRIVELYRKGSSDPEGSPPLEDAWSNLFVVRRVEAAVMEYRSCRSPQSRRVCIKKYIQIAKHDLEPGGW